MTFGNLQSLKYLKAKGISFSHLPNFFSNLHNLVVSDLNDHTNLHDLPPSIFGLANLKTLYIRRTIMEKFREDFAQPQNLKFLYLNECKHFSFSKFNAGCGVTWGDL